MHLVELDFEGVLVALVEAFGLDQLISEHFVFFLGEGNGLFEVVLLFVELRVSLLELDVLGLDQILKLGIFQFEPFKTGQMIFLN